METLNISKNNALKAYKSADKKEKELLENLFGKDVLSQKVTDRIKSYEDACADQGKDPKVELPWKSPINDDQVYDNTIVELRIIAKSLKGTAKVNWSDSNEKKWRPWFEYSASKSGFGFALSGCDFTFTDTGVGSRLSFPTQELSDYFGSQFLDKHNIVLLNE